MRGLDFRAVHRHIGGLWEGKKNLIKKAENHEEGEKVESTIFLSHPGKKKNVFVSGENKLEFQRDGENT